MINANRKAQLFLLIGTIFVIVCLIIYNPSNRGVDEDLLSDSTYEGKMNYVYLFKSFDLDVKKLTYRDGYCLFETTSKYNKDIKERLDIVTEILVNSAEYSNDIRIWVLDQDNLEIVVYVYEYGVLTQYGK